MESTHEPVAVLGIGAMGHGMAASALRAGIRTIVWNRNPAASRDLAALGGEVADTAADAARRAANALGQRTTWVGPIGAGPRLKLVNYTWVAFAAEAAASSVAGAHRLGLDTEKVMDALAGSPLVSAWQAANCNASPRTTFSPVRFVARAQGRMPRLAGGRFTGTRAGALAATSHGSGRQALPCCGGGDGPDHRRVRYSFGGLRGGGER